MENGKGKGELNDDDSAALAWLNKRPGVKANLIAGNFIESATGSDITMIRLSSSKARAREINEELKENAKRGRPFRIEGPHKQKKNTLTPILEKTYLGLKSNDREPTFKEVVTALPITRSMSAIGDIQDKDEEYIYWLTKEGKEKKTRLSTIRNKLSKIKKKHSKHP